jgi:hypothetical protein
MSEEARRRLTLEKCSFSATVPILPGVSGMGEGPRFRKLISEIKAP